MTEQRTLIAEVPSGKIEIVFDGVTARMEFNCECLDALPYCHGMCCRLRTNFTVILRPEEIAKFEHRPFPHNTDLKILQHNESDASCVYLKEDKCSVHESGKPWACRSFHCSPAGVGEGVLYRQNGWLLSPWQRYGIINDQGTVVDWEEMYKSAGEQHG